MKVSYINPSQYLAKNMYYNALSLSIAFLASNVAYSEDLNFNLTPIMYLESSIGYQPEGQPKASITASKLYFGAIANVGDRLEAKFGVLYKDKETDSDVEIQVDTATLDFKVTEIFHIKFGQDYIPFGSYTPTMAETFDSYIQMDANMYGITIGGFIYNSDNSLTSRKENEPELISDSIDTSCDINNSLFATDKNDSINNFGGFAEAAIQDFFFHASFVNNIFDTDALTETIPCPEVDGEYVDRLSGISLYGEFSKNIEDIKVTAGAGYVSNLGTFEYGSNIENAMTDVKLQVFSANGAVSYKGYTLAGSLEQTNNLEFISLPLSTRSVALSTKIHNLLGVQARYTQEVFEESDTKHYFNLGFSYSL